MLPPSGAPYFPPAGRVAAGFFGNLTRGGPANSAFFIASSCATYTSVAAPGVYVNTPSSTTHPPSPPSDSPPRATSPPPTKTSHSHSPSPPLFLHSPSTPRAAHSNTPSPEC